MGGGTPAALAADWLTSAFDQVAFAWASSPFASRLEQVAVAWLRDLFELPGDFGGVLTTGATMANFAGAGGCAQLVGRAARDRRRRATGSPALPRAADPLERLPASERGAGARDARPRAGNVARLRRDGVGRLDLEALERELRRARRRPAIVIANAGEVNAGDFDPIDELADLAERARRLAARRRRVRALRARSRPRHAALDRRASSAPTR